MLTTRTYVCLTMLPGRIGRGCAATVSGRGGTVRAIIVMLQHESLTTPRTGSPQ